MPQYLVAFQLRDDYDPSLEPASTVHALAWARKAAVACRVPVDVRAIFFNPGA